MTEEKTLRPSKERLRRAELTDHSGHWEVDLNTGMLVVSEGAKALFGLAEDELAFEDVKAIPLPEYRPLLDRALKQLTEEGKPYDVEFKIRRPTDGKILDIHSQAELSPGRGTVFGVIHDITERKRAEVALARGSERRRFLFKQSMDGIVLLDHDGTVYDVKRESEAQFKRKRRGNEIQ